MKKPFDQTVVGKIAIGLGKVLLGVFLKSRKFNKTPQDSKNIDDIINNIP